MKNLCILFSTLLIFSCNKDKNDDIEEQETTENELNSPSIQTPEPVIYLADNLDEQDNLGWCIDTQGNGFSDIVHAHSCKPTGGDVQFYYNEETRQIFSAEYDGFCIEMTGGAVQGMTLNLVQSHSSSSNQKFNYNSESGEFIPEGDDTLCLAVGATSASAGPYMSRTLSLEPIATTDVRLKKWVIKGTAPNPD
nr:hypothetical protein [uncultured Allomuricauda sp.]